MKFKDIPYNRPFVFTVLSASVRFIKGFTRKDKFIRSDSKKYSAKHLKTGIIIDVAPWREGKLMGVIRHKRKNTRKRGVYECKTAAGSG